MPKDKSYIRDVKPLAWLYRDRNTGVAMVKDHSTGLGHSAHPSIDASGSVSGMKARGHWGRRDRTARAFGFIFNLDRVAGNPDDELDAVALAVCCCVACAERRLKEKA